jgi:ElaB/YqjD/DUF883 family membrane-anchored ribosome-binding protein
MLMNESPSITQVEPSELLSFQDKYSAILRSSLTTYLKKRDKAKERRVDKLLKERRKRMEEDTNKVKVTAVGSSKWSRSMSVVFRSFSHTHYTSRSFLLNA